MSDFITLAETRKNILSVLENYTNEQLNEIPDGFRNNLIWNLGHVIVTQQLLCYKRSGLEIRIRPELIDKYRKGSKPEGVVSDEEISLLKSYALSTVDQMEKDFAAGHFKNYNEYTTSFGVTLKSSAQAIAFNNVHEGMHLGYVLAIRKLIKSV